MAKIATENCGKYDIINWSIEPCLPPTVFFVENWAKIALEADPSVMEGNPWQSFDKMTYKHGKLWLMGL